MMKVATPGWRLLGATLILALLVMGALGCGSDSDTGAAAETEQAAQAGESGSLEGEVIRLGMTGNAPDDLPVWVASDILGEQGIEVETTEFAEQEVAVQNTARGSIDATVRVSVPAIIQAVQAGVPIRMLVGFTKNTQILVTTADVTDPMQLDGKSIGVHSEVSFSNALAKYFEEDNGISTEVLIVPGSDSRAQALARGGQLDAAIIGLEDYITISEQYRDRFAILEPFDLPGLIAFGVVASEQWVEENHDLAVAFVEALVESYRRLGDFEFAMEYANEHYPDYAPTEELLRAQVRALSEGGYFPPDGDVSPEACEASIEFLLSVGQIEGANPADHETYCRYDIIQEALSELE